MSDELDSINPEDHQPAIEEAKPEPFKWRDQELKRFNVSRQWAFQRLGVISPNNVGEAALAIVRLCMTPDDGIDGIRSREFNTEEDRKAGINGTKKFRREMNAWADSLGITLNNDAGKELIELAEEIYQRDTK